MKTLINISNTPKMLQFIQKKNYPRLDVFHYDRKLSAVVTFLPVVNSIQFHQEELPKRFRRRCCRSRVRIKEAKLNI